MLEVKALEILSFLTFLGWGGFSKSGAVQGFGFLFGIGEFWDTILVSFTALFAVGHVAICIVGQRTNKSSDVHILFFHALKAMDFLLLWDVSSWKSLNLRSISFSLNFS